MKADNVIECDVLVIGGGLGGAFAAIKAKESGAKKVVLAEKGYFSKTGCSGFGAGVITPFLPEEDDYDAWFKTMVEQAGYFIDQNMLKVYLEEAHKGIEDMEQWGVEFVRKGDGYERIFARGGDPNNPVIKTMMFRGGPKMMAAMARRTLDLGIEVINRIMITDLILSRGRVVGAVGFNTRTAQFFIIKAKATIIATGGVSFKDGYHATKNLTGDGHAMLYRAGAELMNYEFIGHHVMMPKMDILGFMMFVALGGKFINKEGERFLVEYDPVLQDRTDLPILVGAMALEHKAGRSPIYIDLTHLTSSEVKRLKEILPLFVKMAERDGIIVGDKIVKKMELVPCLIGNLATGGGARVEEGFRTSLPGLFAAGSGTIAPTAGAAFTYCLVSGPIAGRSAAEYSKEVGEIKLDEDMVMELERYAFAPLKRKDGIEPELIITALQQILMPYEVFVLPNQERLERALSEVMKIKDELLPAIHAADPHHLVTANEVRNMVQCAEIWLRCAMERKESREGLWREDYPETDNIEWLKWMIVKEEAGCMKIWTEPIPIENYPLKPKKREKFRARLFRTKA